MRSFAHRSIILLAVFALMVAACGGSTQDAPEALSESSTATTVSPATTAIASSTTTTSTTMPTTTTTTLITTTTTSACPADLHAIAISTGPDGEDVEPGSYKVPWAPPDFVFTVSNPTKVWILYDYAGFEIQPIPYPEWQPQRRPPFLGEFDFLVSYDGASVVELPDDPGAWLTGHPLLSSSSPESAVIDGYDGVQVDAKVLEGHPGMGSQLVLAGTDLRPGRRSL